MQRRRNDAHGVETKPGGINSTKTHHQKPRDGARLLRAGWVGGRGTRDHCSEGHGLPPCPSFSAYSTALMSRTTAAAFAFMVLLYTMHGLLPGRFLVPADLPRDLLAWKGRADVRVRVSNSLLSDVALQFVPWDLEARRQLSRGQIPWRNRFAGDGAPLFANPQTALLSPFTWPRLLIGLRGWAWTVLLKLAVAAFGMYWLGRVVGLSDVAARLTAIVFAWCGYATTLSLHPHTNIFVLLPSFCAATLLLSRGATVRRVVAVAGLAALLTAGGHPETLFVGVISVFAFVYLNREKASRMGFVLAGAFAGFLLIAVQIAPFLLILWNSHARVARATELPAHFRALSVIGLVLPGILGSPLRDELDLTGAVPNAENFVARSGSYVGALGLLAILVSFRQLPPVLRRGIAIGLAGLLFSWWIPGIRDVLRLLPVIRWIAFDCFVIPFALFASLAAGPALVMLADAERRRRLGAVLILCGSALVVAGALPSVAPDLLVSVARSGIEHLQKTGHLHQAPSVYLDRLGGYIAAAKWTAIRRALLPGACWLAFGVALLARPSRWRRRVLFAAAVGELAIFGYGFAPSIRTTDIAPPPPAVAASTLNDPERRWLIAGAGEAFPANLGTTYQLRQVDSYDVLTTEETTRQLERAGYDPFFHAFPLRPTEPQLAALASMGVRFWIGETGVTELANPRPPAPLSSGPPGGLGVGLAGSALGLVLLMTLALWARR